MGSQIFPVSELLFFSCLIFSTLYVKDCDLRLSDVAATLWAALCVPRSSSLGDCSCVLVIQPTGALSRVASTALPGQVPTYPPMSSLAVLPIYPKLCSHLPLGHSSNMGGVTLGSLPLSRLLSSPFLPQ